MERIRFYFDYLSPYAYLAWRQLGARRLAVEPVPVVFGALLKTHGQLGPAEIPAKRRFVIRDCLRIAHELEVGFSFPATHPFRPIEALRLSLPEVAGDDQCRVIDTLWHAGWELGTDLSDPQALTKALDTAGLDGSALLQATRGAAAKAALRSNTERAIDKGVFGVPSFEIGEVVLWGRDQIDIAFAVADGKDPVDPAVYREAVRGRDEQLEVIERHRRSEPS